MEPTLKVRTFKAPSFSRRSFNLHENRRNDPAQTEKNMNPKCRDCGTTANLVTEMGYPRNVCHSCYNNEILRNKAEEAERFRQARIEKIRQERRDVRDAGGTIEDLLYRLFS